MTTHAPAAAAGTVRIGDRSVHRMGFGAMRVTGRGIWGPPADPEGARALLRRVVELGVNFIDTADSYGPEVSENLIAEALHPYPDDLIVATKGGLVRPGPSRWTPDCRPERLKECCEASLRRLRTDCIDLYQLHTVDAKVPFTESLGALVELREEGKVREIGLSNVTREHIESAVKTVPIASVQNRYGLGDLKSDPVVDHCEQAGIAFIPWYPLGDGSLTRPGGPLDAMAHAHQVTQAQVALAWLLQRSPQMLPIPGTSSVAHLEENVAAAALRLTDEEREQLG